MGSANFAFISDWDGFAQFGSLDKLIGSIKMGALLSEGICD